MFLVLLWYWLLYHIQPVLPRHTSYEIYMDYQNSEKIPKRILELMENYALRGSAKIETLTPIRGQYEESPHFELGYVVSELLDKYKKLIENTKRPIDYPNDAVYDVLKKTIYVQRIFFEIYHLVNMVHELPRKYANNSDFADPEKFKTTPDPMEQHRIMERIKNLEKVRKREKKAEMKRIKKSKQLLKAAGGWMSNLRNKVGGKNGAMGKSITRIVDTERPVAVGRTISRSVDAGNVTVNNITTKKDSGESFFVKKRTRRPANRWWPIDYGWEINYYW